MERASVEALIKSIEETKNNLSADRLDMSFGEIISMYEREEIVIDPEYQRLFRWNASQQTNFIESLVLGIPIPPIFVAERENGVWELVDGLQRVSTVLSFFGTLKKMQNKNNWLLGEGALIKEMENYTSSDVPMKLKLNIKRAICRIEIVKWNSKMDMRYELFNRLNTGGSPLTRQEIRNCIFRENDSSFNILLKKLASHDRFMELVKPTEKQISELYLEELVLRWLALVNDWEQVKKRLSDHMTDFMKKAVKDIDASKHNEKLFLEVINLLHPIGSNIFRASNGSFSPSYYDAITIAVSHNIKYYQNNKSQLEQKIKQLKNTEEFNQYMGSASSNKTNVVARIELAMDIFKAPK